MASVMRQPPVFVLLVLVWTYMSGTNGYPMYQNKIPNGDRVTHPCNSNKFWYGVGHTNAQGGGARNPFGLDFAAHNHVWTPELCNKDSDGDGRTNGQELGDPNCQWTEGDSTQETSIISHPGICEPVNSPACLARNESFDACQPVEFECDAINQPDVRNITIRLPETPVPEAVTTYICVILDLPTDGDYHMIANKQIIDNVDVMHHIILTGCDDTVEPKTTPYSCGMEAGREGGCTDMIGGWALGGLGACLNPDAGFRIGSRGYKRVKMELHWNNPARRTDFTDSSGMVLYYTPNLRPNDYGILTVGQMSLVVPPVGGPVTIGSTCSPSCSNYFLNQDVNIDSVNLHMHYLGYSAKLDQFRNGEFLRTLGEDAVYQYDTPVDHLHTPAVDFRPGDELKMSCTFKPSTNGQYVFYGEDTDAEMCFGFISYYPKQNWTQCVDYGDIHFCEVQRQRNMGEPIVIGGCHTENFFGFMYGLELHVNQSLSAGAPRQKRQTWGMISPNDILKATTIVRILGEMEASCFINGVKQCTPACQTALASLRASDPCFAPDILDIMSSWGSLYETTYPLTLGFAHQIATMCDLTLLYSAITTSSTAAPTTTTQVQGGPVGGTPGSPGADHVGVVMIFATAVAMAMRVVYSQ